MSAPTERRLAVVTGASRGIGAAAAELLSEKGYAVALVCEHNLAMAGEIADRLNENGGEACAFAADLSREAAVRTLFSDIEAHFGRMPDVLVNNAGIAHANVFADEKNEDYDRVFDVNVRSVFLCCRAVYDSMVAKKWGRIINVSSMWGVTGASCEVLYSASKAAVIGMTKGLALELAPSGITVNAIAPGVIKTDMLDCYDEETLAELARETPVGRLGTPADIAAVIAFLASGEASFVTGQVIGANGGYIT